MSTSTYPGYTQSRPLFAPPALSNGEHNPSASSSSSPSTNAPLPFDENDPRIYFDRQSDTWKYEPNTEDDVELEWSIETRAWIPVFDDDIIRQQQAAYTVDGVDEAIPAKPLLRVKQKKRQRSPNDVMQSTNSGTSNKQQKRRINTSVYVTGLPLDCTKDEIAKVFSRYGVLNEDDEGQPRVKMYADEKTSLFKGEALVTYFKQESVELAINVLDESCLRALEGKSTPIMRVMQAEFENKNQKEDKEIDKAKHESFIDQLNTDKASAAANPKPDRIQSQSDKKRAQKRYAKMNNKLLDWDSDSEYEREELVAKQNGTKVDPTGEQNNVRQVCLRRMFTIAELEEEPALLLDLKEDVREECESLGKVTNVVLWDKEPEGIMTVKFSQHSSAIECVQKMNGRFFGGRQIIAHLLPGKARFKRSGREDDVGDGEEEDDDHDEQGEGEERPNEERRRQDAFGDWLEGQED